MNTETVKAPAKCRKCGAIYSSPTTGYVGKECHCGGELVHTLGCTDILNQFSGHVLIEHELVKERDSLQQRLDKAKSALEFYAKEENWLSNHPNKSDVESDHGNVAQDALDLMCND